MKAVKIKKNGGPEVLEVEKITLRKLRNQIIQKKIMSVISRI